MNERREGSGAFLVRRRMDLKEMNKRPKSQGLKEFLKSQYLQLVLLGVAGVALIIIGGSLQGPARESEVKEHSSTVLTQYENEIAREIERVVSTIRGVGKVSASVTLESGPKSMFALNIQGNRSSQKESTSSGEIRESSNETKSSQPVIARLGSGDTPLVEAIGQATVAGCLVVAEGASSSQVKLAIYRAVETLLNVPLYRVQVLPMKGGK